MADNNKGLSRKQRRGRGRRPAGVPHLTLSPAAIEAGRTHLCIPAHEVFVRDLRVDGRGKSKGEVTRLYRSCLRETGAVLPSDRVFKEVVTLFLAKRGVESPVMFAAYMMTRSGGVILRQAQDNIDKEMCAEAERRKPKGQKFPIFVDEMMAEVRTVLKCTRVEAQAVMELRKECFLHKIADQQKLDVFHAWLAGDEVRTLLAKWEREKTEKKEACKKRYQAANTKKTMPEPLNALRYVDGRANYKGLLEICEEQGVLARSDLIVSDACFPPSRVDGKWFTAMRAVEELLGLLKEGHPKASDQAASFMGKIVSMADRQKHSGPSRGHVSVVFATSLEVAHLKKEHLAYLDDLLHLANVYATRNLNCVYAQALQLDDVEDNTSANLAHVRKFIQWRTGVDGRLIFLFCLPWGGDAPEYAQFLMLVSSLHSVQDTMVAS